MLLSISTNSLSAEEQQNEENDDSDNVSEGGHHVKKVSPSEIKTDENGWPVLPLYENQSLPIRKDIICNYSQ